MDKTFITFGIPKELKKQLQIYCIKANINMTDLIIKSIKKEIALNKN